MITKKAKKLSKEAKWNNDVNAANALYKELIDNCHPTKEEFSDLVSAVIMTASMMWDLYIYIPKWQEYNSRMEG
jgi:hypothetical protein